MKDNLSSLGRRRFVGERAYHACEYCFTPADHSSTPFELDHIEPSSKGGTSDVENLALACRGCNNYKQARTEALDPSSRILATLYNPRRDKWNKHFRWTTDFLTIVGISPIGRATVAALRLNRVGVVNLRRVLQMLGKHPPEWLQKLYRD